MNATTLLTINAPTLAVGMAELLHIADATVAAQAAGCGVTIVRDESGHRVACSADLEVAEGVYCTEVTRPVRPWADDGFPTGLPVTEESDQRARRELLELLAHVTHGDIIATSEGVTLL